MTKLKQSLTRKVGPLPAWAWAIIAGTALYIYRSRQALASGAGTPASTDANSPGVTDQTGGGAGGGGAEPVTLGPGESVYDPNTGQLIGAAPDQQSADTQPPITLEPGESAFDPNTGEVVGPDAEPQTGAAGTNVPGKHKASRHKPKAKHGHKRTKGVGHPTHGKTKPRSLARLVSGGRKMKAHRTKGGSTETHHAAGRHTGHGAPTPKGRTRGKVSTHPTVQRARAATAPPPALRQRPAAPHITHPATQRVEPHPARATPAPRPAPRPAPKRRRK